MKSASISFEQYNDNDTVNGIFMEPDSEAWLALQEEFYDICDFSEYQDEYISKLLDVLEREPFFLDAYAHIGSEYLESGDVSEAENYYQKGLDIALKLIPGDFKGGIPWFHLSNRPFLRLHHGYILCQMRQCRYEKAVQLMEQHLAWNTNDNIGVRYLIGEACLQAGFTQKAEKYLSEDQNT